ncbi:hypothetical protein HAP94_06345 [Acidithiobacillus ferrivorans]|nr:hypothetical protein [Acidithiobacillus ferrivorans]
MPCYIERTKDGGTMFLCGDLGPHCAAGECAAVSGFLCDYPAGEGRTCDLPLCASHAYEVAQNVHYCPGHLILWKEFRDNGGVKRELEKVVPYSQGKNAD